MDAERRKALEARRRELKAELARRQRLDLIRGWTDYLEERGVEFEIVMDAAPQSRWIDRHFPTRGTVGRIDWAQVRNASKLPAERRTEGAAWLVEQGNRLGLSRGHVVIIWSNGSYPALRISFADFVAELDVLADDFEMWIVGDTMDWLLEITDDDGWHIAAVHSPAADPEAGGAT